MDSTCSRHLRAAALLLIYALIPGTHATSITPSPVATSATQAQRNATGTCEFRTINYITDTLPQFCLLSSWSNANYVTASPTPSGDDCGNLQGAKTDASITSNDNPLLVQETAISETVAIPATETHASIDSTSSVTSGTVVADNELELNDASFLSFEEWKKRTLERAGQSNTNIGNRGGSGNREARKRDRENIQNNLDSLGDENELDIDFDVFRGSVDGSSISHGSRPSEPTGIQETQDEEDTKQSKGEYRSKDAGKTCKERFSYASFDAGATVLKTHPGAKNAKAVLVENKDSYMLSECSAENKFIIIELSEDIWIDTVVLANYEFFSSMIRNFRVSVSDRYPVKPDKWKDLGTYEARNSREIQAFLIENPQIWARYLRIEFLSHYGNEYYCPVSLIRVHGTRMLESWKETEAGNEEDETDNIEIDIPQDEATNERTTQPISSSLTDQDNNTFPDALEIPVEISKPTSTEQLFVPWLNSTTHIPVLMDQYVGFPLCFPSSSVLETISPKVTDSKHGEAFGTNISTDLDPAKGPDSSSVTETNSLPSVSTTPPPQDVQATSTLHESTSDVVDGQNSNRPASESSEATSQVSTKAQEGTNIQKVKSSAASTAPAASPTPQESFFKAVSRRLQLLEANSTLSLQYIEEQSRILREAFSKVEKKQLQKTTTFLEILNNTVLAELQVFRQQYDEIWQATVISLDSQRAESQREILAISARLNILADEVVFQKRMSIVQSVLLLLCLGLVIFSRVSSAAYIEFPNSRRRASRYPANLVDDSPSSPDSFKGDFRESRDWSHPGRIQEHLDEPSLRVENLDHAPLTPISTYSGSERGGSPMVIDESIPRVEEPAHNDSSVLMAGSLMPNSHRRSFSGWHDVADSSVNLPEFRISQSQEDEFLNQTMNLDVTASRDHMGDGSEELCGPETAHRTLHKPLPALPPDSS